MDFLTRKRIRLPDYDYSTPGYYFITICTRDKQPILGQVVGTGLPDGPKVALSDHGKLARRQLEIMTDFYPHVKLEKYIVMPNHVHMILHITESEQEPSGRPVPTQNPPPRKVEYLLL